jgi:hypothetical protein
MKGSENIRQSMFCAYVPVAEARVKIEAAIQSLLRMIVSSLSMLPRPVVF